MRGRERKCTAIAGSEQLFLALVAAAPDRPDCMDDVLCLQAIFAAARDLGRAGTGAGVERAALGQQFRSGGAMDGAVDPAAAEQRAVRRIDDGVDLKRGDVCDADFEPRRADLGGEQETGGLDHCASLRQSQACYHGRRS